MKKLVSLTAALCCHAALSFGQFIPPVQSETNFPSGLPYQPYQITHTSNVGTRFNSNDALHVYSYSGDGPSAPGGFAWQWTDNSNTVIYDKGDLSYYGLMDIDVTTLGSGWGTYAQVVVAYYSTGTLMPPGHYVSFFDYNGSGMTYVTTKQLSSAPNYGRISIDLVQNQGGFNVVWDDGNDLYMAFGGFNGNIYDGPFVIPNTSGCRMPDVACARGLSAPPVGSTLIARIVYLDPGGQFVVSHWDVNDPSHTFYVDDVQPAPPMYSSAPYTSALSSTLNLDCPDIYNPFVWQNYSYVYEDANDIACRVAVTGNPTMTYNLTDGSIFSPSIAHQNLYPTVSYDPNGTSIYYGWWWKGKSLYLAAKLNDNGTQAVTGYQIVSNTTRQYGPLTFNKNWFIVTPQQMLFCAYPDVNPSGTGTDLITKLNPYGSTSFKQSPAGSGAAAAVRAKHLTASPNPFSDRLSVQVFNGEDADAYTFQLTDMQGRTVRSVQGTVAMANDILAAQSAQLPAGTYFLRVAGNGLSESVKLVKQ